MTSPPLDPPSAPGPSVEPVGELPQPPQQPPTPYQKLVEYFAGWEIINEQQEFYDERDCLGPSHNPAGGGLGSGNEGDVVIFDYSLDPDYLGHASGNPQAEEGSPPPPRFGADDDILYRVSKSQLIGCKQFDQIINNPGKDPLLQSRGPRLGVM